MNADRKDLKGKVISILLFLAICGCAAEPYPGFYAAARKNMAEFDEGEAKVRAFNDKVAAGKIRDQSTSEDRLNDLRWDLISDRQDLINAKAAEYTNPDLE